MILRASWITYSWTRTRHAVWKQFYKRQALGGFLLIDPLEYDRIGTTRSRSF